MKVYIAGPLFSKKDRDFIENIDEICKELGINTFLPHRDVGLWKNGIDFKKIAKGDIEGFKDCNLMIANLSGFNISAGTVWEMGYAYAKKIPVIGIKINGKPEDFIEEISAIVMGTTIFVKSLEELKDRLKEFKEKL